MARTYVTGIAPRSETYMRTHWDHAKGFVTDDELEQARVQERQRWQEAQRHLDWVSPSYVETEDLTRPITALEGAEAGPLTRTFETNTFHRQLLIRKPLDPKGLHGWIDTVALEQPWVLTLPSPYDLLKRAEVEPAAVESVLNLLREAAQYGIEKGAARVVFYEPSACYARTELDAVGLLRWLTHVSHGIESRCITHLVGNPDHLGATLQKIPTRGLALELGDEDVDLSGFELTLAGIQGDSTLQEELDGSIELFRARYGKEPTFLTNHVFLEHVPFELAKRKLQSLVVPA